MFKSCDTGSVVKIAALLHQLVDRRQVVLEDEPHRAAYHVVAKTIAQSALAVFVAWPFGDRASKVVLML
jgi:hypothetical protein